MTNWIASVVLGFVLVGCTWNSTIDAIDHRILLHDNSSKVWLVDKMLIGKRDYTPLAFEYHELIVFHKSNQAYFYKMNELGKSPGKHMPFWLDEEKKEIGFTGVKKDLLFSIKTMSRSKLHLIPKNKSYPYELVLIPFPEY